MKRKTFIKQLMGAAMSRNDAADCATLAQDAGREYFKVLGDLLNFHRQDFGNPLAWLKIRHTIIFGYNSVEKRFFENIDEVHKMDGSQVAEILEAGAAVKPAQKIVMINVGATENWWPRFDWPPNPQPAAGWLYAIDTTPKEETSELWKKENPHTVDIIDAVANAVNAMHERQRGVLGR